MKLRTKLTLAFLIVALPVIFIGYVGVQTNSRLSTSYEQAKGDLIPSLQALSNLGFSLRNLRDLDDRALSAKGQSEHPDELSSIVKQVKAELQYFSRFQNSYLSVARKRESTPPFLEEFGSQSKLIFNLFKVRSQRYQLRGALKMRDPGADELLSSFELLISRATDYEIDHYIQRNKGIADINWTSQKVFYSTVALCLLLAYGFSLVLASHLARPLEKLTEAARSVDARNMFVFTGISQSDEVGELALAFESMLVSLQQSTVSTSYLESIFNSLPIGLFVTDCDGCIRRVNKTAERLLEIDEGRLNGLPINDIFKGNQKPFSENSNSELVDETFLRGYETQIAFEGTELPVIVTMRALVNDDSEVASEFLFAALDLSANVEIKRERDAYREQLRQSSQMAALGTMSAILAHKLSQPLTSVRLFLQQLRRESGDESRKLEQSLAELKRVEVAIKDVLRFSRQTPAESYVKVSLKQTVEKVFELLAERAERANVSLSHEGLSQLHEISAGEGEVDEMLYTLLENAIDAAPAEVPSSVVVKGLVDGCADSVTFSIVDSCGGISEEHLDRIFDLFFTTKGLGEGTGLGLCIVKQIVDRLQGTISVENKAGVGATFRVSLPIMDKSQTEMRA